MNASLPSSRRGLNLRLASHHAPAAYIGSLHQCQHLVAKTGGKFAPPPSHLADSLQSLSRAAGRPDWESIQDIDVPLLQHSLSRAIDAASLDALLASATHPHRKALAFQPQYVMPVIGLM